MLFRLWVLFVLVPLVELFLLIWMGRAVGLWPTIALVAATGILGALLARREGLRALTRVRRELAEGRIPTASLLSGAAVLVGGALLLTPGILTDLIGLALLLPPTRELAFRWIRRRLRIALETGALTMSVWQGDSFYRSSNPDSVDPERGRETHGPDTGSGFQFESGSEAGLGERGDEEDRPPRPGEIIQD